MLYNAMKSMLIFLNIEVITRPHCFVVTLCDGYATLYCQELEK